MVAHEVLYAFARLESQSVIHRLHFACMIVIYGLHMPMIEVRETPEFTRWLAALKDQRAVLHIVRRISRVAAGNTGDAKSVGGSVSELRIDHGPGYRVYFTRRRRALVILLCGGDKRTQSRDIRKATEIAEKLED